MTDYQKIESNICLYCEGRLIPHPVNDSKDCENCESHFWFRDDDNSWRNKKSDKLIKSEISDEFRGIISHALLGSDVEKVSKETWDLIISQCADYSFKLLKTNP